MIYNKPQSNKCNRRNIKKKPYTTILTKTKRTYQTKILFKTFWTIFIYVIASIKLKRHKKIKYYHNNHFIFMARLLCLIILTHNVYKNKYRNTKIKNKHYFKHTKNLPKYTTNFKNTPTNKQTKINKKKYKINAIVTKIKIANLIKRTINQKKSTNYFKKFKKLIHIFYNKPLKSYQQHNNHTWALKRKTQAQQTRALQKSNVSKKTTFFNWCFHLNKGLLKNTQKLKLKTQVQHYYNKQYRSKSKWTNQTLKNVLNNTAQSILNVFNYYNSAEMKIILKIIQLDNTQNISTLAKKIIQKPQNQLHNYHHLMLQTNIKLCQAKYNTYFHNWKLTDFLFYCFFARYKSGIYVRIKYTKKINYYKLTKKLKNKYTTTQNTALKLHFIYKIWKYKTPQIFKRRIQKHEAKPYKFLNHWQNFIIEINQQTPIINQPIFFKKSKIKIKQLKNKKTNKIIGQTPQKNIKNKNTAFFYSLSTIKRTI